MVFLRFTPYEIQNSTRSPGKPSNEKLFSREQQGRCSGDLGGEVADLRYAAATPTPVCLGLLTLLQLRTLLPVNKWRRELQGRRRLDWRGSWRCTPRGRRRCLDWRASWLAGVWEKPWLAGLTRETRRWWRTGHGS